MYPHDCSLRHPVGGLGLPQVRSARGLFSLGCIIIFLTCFSFPLTVSLSPKLLLSAARLAPKSGFNGTHGLRVSA